MSDEGERCARCGELGEDRRTLWMACFYAMHELPVPFEQAAIHGVFCSQTGTKPGILGPIPRYADPQGEPSYRQFYLLRVCKDCRAEWMRAIASWFKEKPSREDSCGSGIFVRRNGATVEITREEWDREHPGREPCVFRG